MRPDHFKHQKMFDYLPLYSKSAIRLFEGTTLPIKQPGIAGLSDRLMVLLTAGQPGHQLYWQRYQVAF